MGSLSVEKERSDKDRQWTRRSGEKIWVSDMSERHAKSCLMMLIRKIELHNARYHRRDYG